MNQQWHFQVHDQSLVESLERTAKISPLLARLLASRQFVEPNVVRNFLDAPLTNLQDPNELTGAVEAAEVIYEAIQNQTKIVIHGDYDADGMTGAAIMVRCIELLGGKATYYVPNRLEEGYGLNEESLRGLIERGAGLIVTVDCGIASVQEAELIRSLGVKLIITDHHQYGDVLPEADVIVHPSLPTVVYPHAPLCGAGVAFKVAWAICQRASGTEKVSPQHRDFLLSALSLAAIGTVADVVPLVGENRIIVRHGLRTLKLQPVPGLLQLMIRTNLLDKPSLESTDIGFSIGPRLNAAGRLGQAQLGIELLVTDSPEKAESLAEYIENLNQSRDKLQRAVMAEAATQIEEIFDPQKDPALVLDGRAWHQGVIGIVAGKFAEQYNTPTIVLSRSADGSQPAVGSARSAGLVDLHHALGECSDYLVAYGGHKAAAGLKIADNQIPAFREAFLEHVASESSINTREPKVSIDVEVLLNELTIRSVDELKLLAPFGQANTAPIFCSLGVKVAASPKKMGADERHLSVQLEQHGRKIRAIAFGRGEWADELEAVENMIDIAYKPVINEFRGMRNVEIHLVAWRVSHDVVTADVS